MNFLNKFFKLDDHKTTVKVEIMAGLTTFFAMAYIIFVNPEMLSDPARFIGDPELATKIFNSVFFATCISAFVGTFLMGVLAKMPFAQASGMGLNAFFAYTIMLNLGFTYYEALALVFISGILFIAITIAGFRELIVKAIPNNIKIAISGGIGLFIAYLGLRNAGLVVNSEATGVAMRDFSVLFKEFVPAVGASADEIAIASSAFASSQTAVIGAIIALIGVILIAVLNHLKIKGSIIMAISFATIIGIPLGITMFPKDVFANFGTNFATQWNDFIEVGLFGFVQGFGTLFEGKDLFGTIISIVVIVISFSLVDMFDTIGTLLGTAKKANLLDKDGNMPGMKKALMCDAIATTTGAMLGTSTVTTYVESAAGIGEGGKSGLTSVVTSIMFLLAIPFAPLIGIVPAVATAPALIFVGALMITGLRDLNFDDMTELFPAFLTIAMMPFTASIANGIAFGLISYTVIKLCTGKVKEVRPLTAILSVLFIARFFMMGM